jgi:O-antigen/teichoic acid export membrane protein
VSKKHLKASSIYLGTTLLGKAIPFLLLPFLTRLLSTEQYGYVGLYATMCVLGGAYVGLRPEVYLIREHAKSSDTEFDLIRRALFVILGISTIVFFPVALLMSFWMLPSGTEFVLFAVLATCACGFQGFHKMVSTELQISLSAYKYALLELALLSVHAILALVFVYYISASWTSKVMAELVALVVVALMGCTMFRATYFRPVTSSLKPEIRRAVKFLWPLTFHVVGFAAINMADRAIIGDLMGPESVGLYTVVYMFGMIIGIIHDSFLKAWNPYFYQSYRDVTKHGLLLKLQGGYVLLSFLGLAVFIYVAPLIFMYMIDEKYHGAVGLIPYIALAYTIEGCRKIICGYLYVYSKTKLLASITTICAVLNIVLNYMLIPEYGLLGAAYATLVSFSCMTLFVLLASYVTVTKKI